MWWGLAGNSQVANLGKRIINKWLFIPHAGGPSPPDVHAVISSGHVQGDVGVQRWTVSDAHG